jgi:hypothetical protein
MCRCWTPNDSGASERLRLRCVREAGGRIFLTEARRHGDQGTTDAACAAERKKKEERERERRDGMGRSEPFSCPPRAARPSGRLGLRASVPP